MPAYFTVYYWYLIQSLLKSTQPLLTSWDMLQGHMQAIFKQYANTHIVSDLQCKHHRAKHISTNTTGTLVTEGNMIFENAVHFLHDALISHEFTDSIKCGNSNYMVLVLKIWALSFHGSGHIKYTHEMPHLIHNIEHVWPKPIW
jgi:hypothetical protein